MSREYSKEYKGMIVKLIKVENNSTSRIAEQFNIPLKTVEGWITAYNKNKKIYNVDYLSEAEQIKKLTKENMKLKQDNDILKKTITLIAKGK